METRGGGGVTIENFCWRWDLMFNRALEVFQKREGGEKTARGLYKKVFVCVFIYTLLPPNRVGRGL